MSFSPFRSSFILSAHIITFRICCQTPWISVISFD